MVRPRGRRLDATAQTLRASMLEHDKEFLMRQYKRLATLALAGTMCTSTAAFGQAKNVILMISDGIGFNGWEAAKYYQGGLPYDTPDFDFYGMTNHEFDGGYDPAKYWSDWTYQFSGATDSAASGTALVTGKKTDGGHISVDEFDNPLETIGERAAKLGKATGAVSSVMYNHATPAVVDAHNVSRGNYAAIAADMLSSDLDVIMGGDAQAPGDQIYTDAADAGFAVVSDDDLSDWDDLTDGDSSFRGGAMPTKLFGAFDGATLNDPVIRTKPTLDLMTRAALNVLEQDEDGMFLMVEGGAIDWANHGNFMEGMLHEQDQFDQAVQSVIDWVDNNSSWEETLLIVTSDHETGGIWGPNLVIDDNGTPDDPTDDTLLSDRKHIVDNGVGVLPGFSYNSGNHTNALVPLWVRGYGSDAFASLVDGTDTEAATFWDQFADGTWDGRYIDNTDVGAAMFQNIPEPTSIALLSLGGLALLRRRRA
jgi:alkaline phosphatase